MIQETIFVREEYSESDKYALNLNDEIIVRARLLALEFARALGSRLEPKAHDVLRLENSFFSV